MSPGDAVLYFSYSGATRDIIDTLKLVRGRGAKPIVATRFPKSPGAEL
ncbi:MAG: SIS domain-containing protein [Candidatus Limivicinus sp.]|nr:SIS domain-containing protein [Clostridiales bacterium]MDY3860479.1 SIS domain-containing protein [Candidatus Limivicinus sp.]